MGTQKSELDNKQSATHTEEEFLKEMSSSYNPSEVEQRWSSYWIDKGVFHAEVDHDKEPFTIVIPPPNITGSLHMGHALNDTIQDILIRSQRMRGKEALWLPGTDHAGIATQNVVERNLAAEGLRKEDLGREAFVERVWQWRKQYGNTIINQLKRLGASCDWQRERFTMDEKYSAAVRKVFVTLYEKGYIYRDKYIINWCPRCMTAISDIEVEYSEEMGNLYFIKYPGVDGDDIIVATTRPETMLGDTAVAVNPEDKRYASLAGCKLTLPLTGRKIPIIADTYVDPAFGTGAVKITPAHDPNDFEVGLRHSLEQITVIGNDARMTEAAGKYAGLNRYEAREAIIKDLEAAGLLVEIEPYQHSVGHCYRCNTVIEPLISLQWFMRMKELAAPAIRAVVDGRIRFVPERWTKVYLDWMEHIRDWCISRQIWWGHRLPVWYCNECGEMIISEEAPSSCTKCNAVALCRETDVLDTWFSSALWPFATMGWPEKTPEVNYFYPTSVLVTGHEIIYFWVSRMIMQGLEFMGEIPFHTVYIHGIVRDESGKKMSKSLGNVIDPLEIIDRYGTDALRFAMVAFSATGQDIYLSDEKFETCRNFANKIWNASRFVMMNLTDYSSTEEEITDLSLADRWILSRYNTLIGEITGLLDSLDFCEAGKRLYEFIWSEFCDWYLEMVKPLLYSKDKATPARKAAQQTLWRVLDGCMRLLHPYMPYITEEIWQRLNPDKGVSVAISAWPARNESRMDLSLENDVRAVMELIRAVRNMRAEVRVPQGAQVSITISAPERDLDLVRVAQDYIRTLARVSEINMLGHLHEKPTKAMSAVVSDIEIYLPLEGIIDLSKEQERLSKELKTVQVEIAKVEKKLLNQEFIQKAPQEVVQREKTKKAELQQRRIRLQQRLEDIA